MSNQPADIDLRAAVKAFQSFGRALSDAVEAIGAAFIRVSDTITASLRPLAAKSAAVQRAEARARYGGSGDLFGLWQSPACTGWLHESCPDDPLIDCRCTCHGGELR